MLRDASSKTHYSHAEFFIWARKCDIVTCGDAGVQANNVSQHSAAGMKVMDKIAQERCRDDADGELQNYLTMGCDNGYNRLFHLCDATKEKCYMEGLVG